MKYFQSAISSTCRSGFYVGLRSYQIVKSFTRFINSGISPRQPKLFFIGFNKSGTKTLHHFFMHNGYLSLHGRSWWGKRTHGLTAAQIMKENLQLRRPILTGLSRYQVFSDINSVSDSEIIEANRYFREMHRDHPNAYFVLNHRPVDNWIRSRLNHEGGKHGSFVKKYETALQISREEIIALWKAEYERHKNEVREYFHNNSRFMSFNIETDEPVRLVKFLSNDFELDLAKWEHRGSALERFARQKAKNSRSSGGTRSSRSSIS